jgi:hypothetical protein
VIAADQICRLKCGIFLGYVEHTLRSYRAVTMILSRAVARQDPASPT